MKWNQVSGEFYRDGSWRDICVVGTTLQHWQRVLDGLRTSPLGMRYLCSGVECDLPVNAGEAFPEPGRADRLLSVDLGGVSANAHFFTEEEVEFDLDPSEVTSQRELDSVLQFMHLLADATELDAILTPENQTHIAILRARPHEPSIEYTPFGGRNEAS